MPLYSLTNNSITPLPTTTFSTEQIYERADLQRLLRDQIEIILPNAMVLAEEFGEWDDSRRRIDLLCLDSDANLVIVELKRTETGGHMELQALRYAAMISTMTFHQAAQAHARYLHQRGLLDGVEDQEHHAEQAILEFLNWEEPQDDSFATDVRIVLASQDFNRELTTTAMWLLDRGIDICCVRLTPYKLEQGEVVLNVEQTIPLPEAAEYQIRVREKQQQERTQRSRRTYIKIDLTIGSESWTRISKPDAMLRMFHHLANSGITPAQMAAAIPWRSAKRILIDLDGNLDSDAFCEAAPTHFEGTRRSFQAKQWLVDDDQLIHHDGRTWALIRGWHGRTPEALQNLIELAEREGVAQDCPLKFEVS